MSTSGAAHVLTFRFNGWTGFPDVLRSLLPEAAQARAAARKVWPKGIPEGMQAYIWMPGGLWKVLPRGQVRAASVDERREAVKGAAGMAV